MPSPLDILHMTEIHQRGFEEGSGIIYVLEQSFRQLDGNKFVDSNLEAWDR